MCLEHSSARGRRSKISDISDMNVYQFMKPALLKSLLLLMVPVMALTSCSKEEAVRPSEPAGIKGVNVASRTNQGRLYEWNGVKGDGIRCYDFPCDCLTPFNPPIKSSLRSWSSEDDYEEFLSNLNNGTLLEWYASGKGQQILPLPERQYADVINGLVTFKTFADGGGYFHLVYSNAETLEDRPRYND
jgi:hypothetical protein